MRIESGKKLLFIGDSITDCGRGRPVGVQNSALGDGYVALVNSLLQATWPEWVITVQNTGISGNRVTDLEARWETDVLDLEPDWLSVMIGINDVWRHFDSPWKDIQVTKDQYESVLTRLMERTLPTLDGLVLMSPFLIESRRDDAMRAMMDEYGAVVKALAERVGAVFVDTQAAFDAFLVHRPSQQLCGDRVHPNQAGHMILARAFLEAIGA